MKKPLYIIVTSYFPTPGRWNGAFVVHHAKAVKRTGRYDVVVIHMAYQGPEYEYDGIKVFPLEFDRTGAGFGWRKKARRNFELLEKCLLSHGYSFTDGSVLVACKSTNADLTYISKIRYPRIKTIVWLFDPDPYDAMLVSNRFNPFGLKRMMWYRRNRICMKNADLVLPCSDNVAKIVREFPRQTVQNSFWQMRRAMCDLRFCRHGQVKRMYKLNFGVDTSVFNCGSIDKNPKVFEIGFVGHLWSYWYKDPVTLVKALGLIHKELGEWRCTFIGSGDTIKWMEQFARDNGFEGRLRFLKEMDYSKLPEFYRGLDLFCMPSYWEGFGCVFTEAYACGAPFITCEGQGMDDLIYPEDRKLWLCKEQDPEDLAKKILYFYKNRPKQRLCGEIDIDKLIPAYLDEIEKL